LHLPNIEIIELPSCWRVDNENFQFLHLCTNIRRFCEGTAHPAMISKFASHCRNLVDIELLIAGFYTLNNLEELLVNCPHLERISLISIYDQVKNVKELKHQSHISKEVKHLKLKKTTSRSVDLRSAYF